MLWTFADEQNLVTEKFELALLIFNGLVSLNIKGSILECVEN